VIAIDAVDRHDARYVRHAVGVLRAFNEAGVLAAADIHVALRLGRLANEEDESNLLATALAVRAPRLGSVCVDLATISATAASDLEAAVDLQALPWPEAEAWVDGLASSPLVAVGDDAGEERPLRLVGTTLYLDRYWRDERAVAADLLSRNEPAGDVDGAVLADGLARLFGGDEPDLQRLAAATCVLRRLAVIGGGPGTGKTTTVTRILVLLDEQAEAAGAPTPLVALAAPTGKAAARLEEAVHEEASALRLSQRERARLLETRASTLHRLLGRRGGSAYRFRHDRRNQLPHDVVVVDETSMVSLSMTARLLEAVRSEARLIFVGDPKQLASVEAGAVLADVVGPAADGLLMRGPARSRLGEVVGQAVPATDPPADAAIGDGIVVLRRVHRFAGAIAELAEAVRVGDAEAALTILRAGHDDVRWIEVDVAEPAGEELRPVRDVAVSSGRDMIDAARAGDAAGAMAALGAFRLLCAHRRGPYGVATWNGVVETWLANELDRFAEESWYVGRPLLVTHNDYGLQLYNGDTGVIVARDAGRKSAVFARQGGLFEISPARLDAVDTVHALTIHKSQGSQVDAVAVLLPDPSSRVLTRELMYTAVTRARNTMIICGTEASIRAALGRPISHASGLERRLWASIDGSQREGFGDSTEPGSGV
jgi:exodeoxyribonuclease V alpha subunit